MHRSKKKLLYFTFILYICILLVLLLRVDRLFYIDGTSQRGINIIPLKSILNYAMGSYTAYRAWGNILGNLFMFIPLSIYIESFYIKQKTNIIICAGVSLFVEIFQYVFGTGMTDIDDIILNVIGAFLGIVIFNIMVKIWGHKKSDTIIALIFLVVMTLVFMVVNIPVIISIL